MNTTLSSYLNLRRSVGVLGILLLPVLYTIAGPQESISAYYHTGARDVFVGSLCLIAALVGAYRGYDRGDRICSAAAAVGLVVVALVPVGGATGPYHLAGALLFFASIALLADRFGRGGKRKTFRALAGLIAGSIIASFVSAAIGLPILISEGVAVAAFGVAWVIKGRILEALLRLPQ